jgi:hypothetical protein
VDTAGQKRLTMTVFTYVPKLDLAQTIVLFKLG